MKLSDHWPQFDLWIETFRLGENVNFVRLQATTGWCLWGLSTLKAHSDFLYLWEVTELSTQGLLHGNFIVGGSLWWGFSARISQIEEKMTRNILKWCTVLIESPVKYAAWMPSDRVKVRLEFWTQWWDDAIRKYINTFWIGHCCQWILGSFTNTFVLVSLKV